MVKNKYEPNKIVGDIPIIKTKPIKVEFPALEMCGKCGLTKKDIPKKNIFCLCGCKSKKEYNGN